MQRTTPATFLGRPGGRHAPGLLVLAALVAALATLPPVHAKKKFHTWVDENGVTHISDALPADAVDREVKVYNEQGVVVEVTPPAPTPEERRQREEEARQRARQQAAEEEAREYRRKLFLAYPTVEDLEAYHRSQVRALRFQQAENDRKIRELRGELRDIWTQASRKYNVSGAADSDLPPPPQKVLDALARVNASLEKHQAEDRDILYKLTRRERDYEKDLAIFREYGLAEDGSPARGSASATALPDDS